MSGYLWMSWQPCLQNPIFLDFTAPYTASNGPCTSCKGGEVQTQINQQHTPTGTSKTWIEQASTKHNKLYSGSRRCDTLPQMRSLWQTRLTKAIQHHRRQSTCEQIEGNAPQPDCNMLIQSNATRRTKSASCIEGGQMLAANQNDLNIKVPAFSAKEGVRQPTSGKDFLRILLLLAKLLRLLSDEADHTLGFWSPLCLRFARVIDFKGRYPWYGRCECRQERWIPTSATNSRHERLRCA